MQLVLSSEAMRQAVLEAELAARFGVGSLLVTGEPGVGKEHLARFIHHWGGARGRFVVVHCAAVAQACAAGGPPVDRGGEWLLRMLPADCGTVLLKGVDALPASVQASLLRFLDANARPRPGEGIGNIRVIASGPASLFELVAAGSFDADLYYRLNTLYLRIPPLRERPEDIEPLLRYFICASADRQGVATPPFRDEWRARYDGYGWPGNVRESREVAESIVAQWAWQDLPAILVH